jgi:hypothetical protein
MQTWEILEKAIPRGEAERIAKLMRCSVDTVRKWRREPESDDNTANGRFNPLEDLMLLLDALGARNPDGVETIRDYINGECDEALRIRGQSETLTNAEAEKELRDTARRLLAAADTLAGKQLNGERKRVRG